MELKLEQVSPLLARPLKPTESARVSGWLAALTVSLNSRYRERITTQLEPFFLVKVADAVQRRLDKPKQMVDSETAGPFAARWNSASTLGSWFTKDDLNEMDSIAGTAGTRTYRTPAPDSIRFNNAIESEPEASELEVIANVVVRGAHVP